MHSVAVAIVHILSEALVQTISKMGTSAIAVAVGLFYLAVRLVIAYREGGRDAITSQWKGVTKWGIVITVGIWSLLFIWFVGATIYQEHSNLVAFAATLRHENKDLDDQLNSAKNLAKDKDQVIDDLRQRITDQQSTISSALQANAAPLSIVGYSLGHLSADVYDSPKRASRKETFILLANKTVTPVKLLITCNEEIDSAGVWVLGTGAMMGGGWGGRITTSNKQYGVGILSPAWGPTNPLIVTISSKKANIDPCSYSEQ